MNVTLTDNLCLLSIDTKHFHCVIPEEGQCQYKADITHIASHRIYKDIKILIWSLTIAFLSLVVMTKHYFILSQCVI